VLVGDNIVEPTSLHKKEKTTCVNYDKIAPAQHRLYH
jgi:hypothetical protein